MGLSEIKETPMHEFITILKQIEKMIQTQNESAEENNGKRS